MQKRGASTIYPQEPKYFQRVIKKCKRTQLEADVINALGPPHTLEESSTLNLRSSPGYDPRNLKPEVLCWRRGGGPSGPPLTLQFTDPFPSFY